MAISNIPIFSMLRTRMQWHQERQKLLSENVANADTPNYRPRDLSPPKFDNPGPQVAALGLVRTDAGHVVGTGGGASSQFTTDYRTGYRVRPAGNAVSLEDEMIKVAANQMDYQAATTLYSRSLDLVKTALGRR
jgi:flagellar basal-body rod protein FlgB